MNLSKISGSQNNSRFPYSSTNFVKLVFSLVRLEGTFCDEFRTLTILLLIILAKGAGRSRRPVSASDVIFCLGIVF